MYLFCIEMIAYDRMGNWTLGHSSVYYAKTLCTFIFSLTTDRVGIGCGLELSYIGL